jgi:GT2 family glycosyltransferase
VKSLLESRGVEVIPALVDNNSPGEVPPWTGNTPGLLFSRAPANYGLTASTNTAFSLLEEADPDYILVLNNDTEVEPDAIRLLAEHLESHPEAGIAAPAILYADRPDLVWSAGGTQIPWVMKVRQDYRTPDQLPAEPVRCTSTTGCAILMRTRDYVNAGMQDPGLFVYWEDNDLCFRVRKAGMEIHLVPASRIVHHVSVSVGGVLSPVAIYFTHRNRYIVARRYLTPLQMAVFTIYYTGVTLAKTLIYPLRGMPGLVPWMWKATLHGFAGRTGFVPPGLIPGETSG